MAHVVFCPTFAAMKILVIRFSSIGDIVLCSPVLRCLRQQLGAELHFLTKEGFAGIVQDNPHLSKIYTLDKDLHALLPALRAEGYDHVVDLHHNLRSRRVRWALGRPGTTFDKLNIEKWLLVNLHIDRLPPLHLIDRYFAALHPLGVMNDGLGLDFFIPPSAEIDFERDLGLAAFDSIAFVLGATHATKRLPEEKIMAVCGALQHPVVLLGGKAESAQGERIAAAFGPRVVNCCGKLSLAQSASVVRQAAVIVSHDTGLMHVAAAFRKNIVSIWGSTVPAFGMYPYLPAGAAQYTAMQVPGLACRPCSKIGHERCPKGHFRCMQLQDTAAIVAAVEAYMTGPK
jgi:ADP-heptose:LPS heptosyltransferase